MSEQLQRYLRGNEPLPDRVLSWTLAGTGIASVRMRELPLPNCNDDEVLVRVDAVGLCASDAKMIRMGRDYPLFYNRDLAARPIQLGHEVSLTVIDVGERWQCKYTRGQRLGIQPDVYVNGVRTCFGVQLPGGLTQYLALDANVLNGDAGSYLFPVDPSLSYADVALSEPWACVDVAYTAKRRLQPRAGGVMWIVGAQDDTREHAINTPITSSRVVMSHAPASLMAQPQLMNVQIEQRDDVEALLNDANFTPDDIVLLNPREPQLITRAMRNLSYAGTITLVLDQPLGEWVAVDVGRLHYEPLSIMGCTGSDIAAAWGEARNRSELKAGGMMLILGAGGAMGRMHIQRALQMHDGPRAIIAANRSAERVSNLHDAFAAQANAANCELVVVSIQGEPGRLEREIARLTNDKGCDDVIVVAPTVEAIQQGAQYVTEDGLLMLFAGVPFGTEVRLPVDRIALNKAHITGTSGSLIEDQQRVLAKASAGELSPAQSVVAVGGLKAAGQGLSAVLSRDYPGKIVIFPTLVDLPLMSLSEMETMLPEVHALLAEGERWTPAAEAKLFELFLPQ